MVAHDPGDVREQEGFRGLVPGYAIELCPVRFEARQSFRGGRVTLVGEIVGRPGKAVDDAYGFPEPGRQEQGSDREVFVVACGHGCDL